MNRPIGVFDSGVGGLTVFRALRAECPEESLLYLGDTARLPFGTKSPATVLEYSRRSVEFLLDRGVKAVVVACNTASAVAIERLDVPVPLWGVIEPGAEAAIACDPQRLGVLATESTIASDAYGRAIRRRRPDVEVVSQACPLFVPLVEEGWEDDEITEAIAARYLDPIADHDVDTVVLGCTHYPLLRDVIQRVVGPDVTLIDSATAVARVVADGLAAQGLLADGSTEPEHHLCVTDLAPRFARIAHRVVGPGATLELVDLGHE